MAAEKIDVELWNTEIEEVEAYDKMSQGEIRDKNYALISRGEPQRWIPAEEVSE